MYKITIYVGGLYKFDEFKELVEDLGGLVLKKDRFSFNRGDYFIGEQVHVLTIIPREDKEKTEIIARDIKGRLEKPKISKKDKRKIMACLPIHDILSKSSDWISKESLEKSISCPCYSPVCNQKEEYCFIDYLEEVLSGMVDMEMLEEQESSNGKEYKIKID